MIEDVSAGLAAVMVPALVIIADRDQVEHEDAVRHVFARFLPRANFLNLKGVGHLSPLEAPEASPMPAGTSCVASDATDHSVPGRTPHQARDFVRLWRLTTISTAGSGS
jgi:pimeloyl-ACP methyl ester carboxylesterase